MKKTLLTVLTVLVVTGAGVAATLHYNNYQNKQNAKAQKVAQSQNQKLQADRNTQVQKQAQLVDDYNKLRVQCEVGHASYDKLTPFVRSLTKEPKCGAVRVR